MVIPAAPVFKSSKLFTKNNMMVYGRQSDNTQKQTTSHIIAIYYVTINAQKRITCFTLTNVCMCMHAHSHTCFSFACLVAGVFSATGT